MDEWLRTASEFGVTVIDAMALAVILYGAVEAFVSAVWVHLTASTGNRRREVWLRFARWLVAGLTFQLAADIVETATSPTWDEIGHLAAIAAVRTFLNYFLERDLAEVRDRQIGKLEKEEKTA
ncbi:DUF1622 domain-containing protein (plasmid) [Mesorhizobium muleiense]|uniref:DUF1622 domain-containing protein n=1 Tax=Mesorhizobium muleiense TaxID=1004279 RepID=UPI003AFAD160